MLAKWRKNANYRENVEKVSIGRKGFTIGKNILKTIKIMKKTQFKNYTNKWNVEKLKKKILKIMKKLLRKIIQ